MLGLVLLGLWLRTYAEARVFEARGSRELEAARAGTSAPASNEVLGRIEIPRLKISALISQGTASRQLDRAIGHVASSALPGEPGNCALAGHRDSFLRGIGAVRQDDLIRIETRERSYLYRVVWGSVMKPDRVDVLRPTAESSLTLVTCYPFHMIGPAPERFVVRARLIESID